MPLLLNMSGDDRELMIKVLTHPDFDTRLMPWKSAKQFHSFLDSHEVWERVAVYKEVLPQSADDSPTNFYAFVRKDVDLLLKDLLDSPEAHNMCLESQPVFANDGSRAYTDFASGTWLETVQAATRNTVNPDATPLEIFLYADGAEARSRKHRYHPLLLFLGNFTLDAMRSQRGYVRLAHMSVLAKEDFPQVSDKEFTRIQRNVLFGTLETAIKRLKELSYTGFYHDCTDGEQRFFVPTIAAFVGDIKEANDVFGIAPHPAMHSDISTLVCSQDMNKPTHQPATRTQKQMQEAIVKAKMLEEQSLNRDAKAALKEHSLSLSRLTPLANFAHVDDVFTLYYPDRLHHSNRGVAEDPTKTAEAELLY
ncbi:hypothetical protein WJX77_008088 [Trebouxia sp. C0004]